MEDNIYSDVDYAADKIIELTYLQLRQFGGFLAEHLGQPEAVVSEALVNCSKEIAVKYNNQQKAKTKQ